LPQLREKAKWLLVKLSPMLDVHQAITALGCVNEAHVVAVDGECKEILLLCDLSLQRETQTRSRASSEEPTSGTATRWICKSEKGTFAFTQQEEQTVQPAPTRTYIPPESDSVEESLTQPSPVKRPLHEFLTAQASGEGEVSMFAQEYLRRHRNPQGRASP